jgi:hypothetical protein
MRACKRKLAILWFSSAGVMLITFVLQTIFGHYGTHSDDAWAWLLPTIMPTLSLIIAVLVAEAVGKSDEDRTSDRFMFHLAFILSAGYLVMVALTVFLQPFAENPPVETFKQSSLWLGPVQGLVTAALGVFFVQQQMSRGKR